MKMSRKILALMLAIVLVVGMVPSAWTAPLPLGAVNPNVSAIFADFDLTSPQAIRVLVELPQQPAATGDASFRSSGIDFSAQTTSAWENSLLQAQESVVTQALLHGVDIKALRNYTVVFNGLLVEVPANQVALLSSIPGVKDVWPDVEVWTTVDISVPVIRTPRSLGIPNAPDGKGKIIAILDTGIDYRHPDLGGGFGPNYTVIGGWDFVDDDAYPQETMNRPGNNPAGSAWNTSHGTHVAGTAIAVAPGAKLLSVRVLGPGGSGSSADVMAGIEYVVRAGADVANMSLGAAWGHPESPWARAVDNAVRAGVIFTVSMGNSGPNDGTIGTYAASRLAISVGNADATPKIIASAGGYNAVGTLMTFSPPFTPLFGQPAATYVHVGLGRTTELAGVDLTGRVALIERGVIGFAEKSRNARAAGAIAAVIFNNAPGNFAGTLGSAMANDIPTMSISQQDGQALLALPVAQRLITFGEGMHHLVNSGSSRGPTQLLEIKPDVSAPGTNITAPYPFPGTDGSHVPGAWQKVPGVGNPWFGTIGGTSMSAPHVAGAAAILLQVNPTWTPEQVKLALMNTARDIRWPHGVSFRPVEQGAGMIDVTRALYAKVKVNPGALNFREVTLGDTTQSITIKNYTNENLTYNVSSNKFVVAHDYTLGHSAVVVVPAGGEVALPITLVVGPNLPASEINQNNYTGFINLVNAADADDNYRVPFHFVNRQLVSMVNANPFYFSPNGDGIQDTARISFLLGRPVHSVRVMVGFAGFWRALMLNESGAIAPGAYFVDWDGSALTPDAPIAPDGSYQVHVQVRLTAGGTWTPGFSAGTGATTVPGAYNRIILDRLPPVLHNVQARIDTSKPGHVLVSGNVDDFSINNFQSDGGEVSVNGEKSLITSQNFPGGGDWAHFTSPSLAVNVAEGFPVTVRAADSAGNVTQSAFPFAPLTVNNEATATTHAGTHTVSGRVLPGMTLTIAGQAVTSDATGVFSASVPVAVGRNNISVVASVPQWAGFTPITRTIIVNRVGFRLSADKARLIDGETLVATLHAESVDDLVGFEFEVGFNHALLEVVSVNVGSAYDGKDLFVAVNEVRDGTLRFAAAVTQGQTGFTGSGEVVRITFRSKAAGASTVSLVSAQGVNSLALPVTTTVAGAPAVIGVGPGTISGRIEVPGRWSMVGGVATPRFNDAVITWGDFSGTTNANGDYSLTITGGGTHTLTVRVPGYITVSRVITINGESKDATFSAVLVSGDVNQDGKVTLADLVALAAAYGFRAGQVGYNVNADINADGVIDVTDIPLVTSNYTR